MIDGIPNRPLYFYQKDIIGYDVFFKKTHRNVFLDSNWGDSI